jgi:hypothetical protein
MKRSTPFGLALQGLLLGLFTLVVCADATVRLGLRGRVDKYIEDTDMFKYGRTLQDTSTTYRLFNAVTDTVITTLMQNSVVNIGDVPANYLTIEVSTTGFKPKSVKLSLIGEQSTYKATEGGTFVLCGNSGSNYNPCSSLTLGKYKLTADFYSAWGGNGEFISSSSIDFELTNTGASAPVLPPVTPVSPPVDPPVSPPVDPPVSPPVDPPVSPPVNPPVSPPVLPPVSPPVLPPVSKPSCSIPKVGLRDNFLRTKPYTLESIYSLFC